MGPIDQSWQFFMRVKGEALKSSKPWSIITNIFGKLSSFRLISDIWNQQQTEMGTSLSLFLSTYGYCLLPKPLFSPKAEGKLLHLSRVFLVGPEVFLMILSKQYLLYGYVEYSCSHPMSVSPRENTFLVYFIEQKKCVDC